MSGEKPNPVIQFIILRFKRAAIATHFGYEEEDQALQRAGIRLAKQAVRELDAFDARLALVPLLDDSDWGVRVFAARYLLNAVPERALAILKEIRERCPTRAHMTAFWILRDYERGELET
ncbi:MAG: hypothetical protein WB816_09165 [Methylocystis sp.]